MCEFIDFKELLSKKKFKTSDRLPEPNNADRRHIYLSPNGVPHIIVMNSDIYENGELGARKWWRLVSLSYDKDYGTRLVVGKKVVPDGGGVALNRFIEDTTGWKVLLPK